MFYLSQILHSYSFKSSLLTYCAGQIGRTISVILYIVILSAKQCVSNLIDKKSRNLIPLKSSAELAEISCSCIPTNTKRTILIFTMMGEEINKVNKDKKMQQP